MKIVDTQSSIGENKISIIDLYNNKLLVEKTGIEFVYQTNKSTVELALSACKKIKNYKDVEFNLCVLVTQTPDDFLPANAINLSEKLKLPRNCLTFDINQGCSGFVQAFCILEKLIKFYKNTLLVTVDKYRSKLNIDDRSTNAVFSDGATATYLTNSEDGKILFEDHYTDGSKRNLLFQSTKNNENKVFLHMSGAEVWMFTRIKVVPQIIKAINFCNENNLQLAGIYMHQASKVVVEGISDLLPVDKNLVFKTYSDFGNTVSSTIPFMFEKHPIRLDEKNSVYILAGFGVGLTSTVIVYGRNND